MDVAACPRDMFTPTLTALIKEVVLFIDGTTTSLCAHSLSFQAMTGLTLPSRGVAYLSQ
jgi:hypothetical protein